MTGFRWQQHWPDFGYVTATTSLSLKINSCANLRLSAEWVSLGSRSPSNSRDKSLGHILSESYAMYDSTGFFWRVKDRKTTRRGQNFFILQASAGPGSAGLHLPYFALIYWDLLGHVLVVGGGTAAFCLPMFHCQQDLS